MDVVFERNGETGPLSLQAKITLIKELQRHVLNSQSSLKSEPKFEYGTVSKMEKLAGVSRQAIYDVSVIAFVVACLFPYVAICVIDMETSRNVAQRSQPASCARQ